MIVEMRTVQLKPRSQPEVLKRLGEALPARLAFSPLGGVFYTDVGPLNRIIELWPYAGLAEREQIRAKAAASGAWPPQIAEFIEHMDTKILVPAPFTPPLEPRQLGGVYEFRTYTYKAGTIPQVIARWSEAIGERVKLSPLVGAWYSELGPLNQWTHVWAYKDAAERQRIREEAVKRGIWPPKGGGDLLQSQENLLAIPAGFSPLH
ncbi:MAG TPA: NIPSNAP family protein [Stellaceae bacterium]|nr:NIPSNAP family protein [Stellaceae bacterium]